MAPRNNSNFFKEFIKAPSQEKKNFVIFSPHLLIHSHLINLINVFWKRGCVIQNFCYKLPGEKLFPFYPPSQFLAHHRSIFEWSLGFITLCNYLKTKSVRIDLDYCISNSNRYSQEVACTRQCRNKGQWK